MKFVVTTIFVTLLAGLALGQQSPTQTWQKVSYYDDSFSIVLPKDIIVYKDEQRGSVTLISSGTDSAYVVTATKNSPFMSPKGIMRRSTLAKLAKRTSEWKTNDFEVDVYEFTDKNYFLHLEIEAAKVFYSVSMRSKSLDDEQVSLVLQSLKARGSFIVKGKGEPSDISNTLIGEKLETSQVVLDFFRRKQSDDVIVKFKDEPVDELPPDHFFSRTLFMLQKPRASYTDSARENNVQGTIVLKVEFKADGDLGFIVVSQGLPNGLSQEAVNAAKKIKFLPAMQDGKPVTVIKRIEYSFAIY